MEPYGNVYQVVGVTVNQMKAAIYNPYLDTLGGGERYSMAVATVLARAGYEVDVEWENPEIKSILEQRFGINLSTVNFVRSIDKGDGYDVCFWVSDGSIPLLRARTNLLHFQFPFKDMEAKTLLNKTKLIRINKIICNSQFTKSFIDQEYGVQSDVLYPPVDTTRIKSMRKTKTILYVGRFSALTQAKGQDELVRLFKSFYKADYKTWKLVLAGGVEVGVGDLLKNLKAKAKGLPIEFVESPTYKELLELYGKSKLFWSAAGYGIPVDKQPTKVEHFGMTIVEAMAAGCVPIVFDAGGHKEIVKEGINGYLWKKGGRLLNATRYLIDNPKQLHTLAKKAVEDAKEYSYANFESNLLELIAPKAK